MNQLFNGLMRRKDHAKILRIPFGQVPAGSQNALAISINGNLSAEEYTFLIIRGKTKGLDIIQTHNQDDGTIVYSLICVGLGMIGDILHESENHRWMGPTRYQFSALKQFLGGPQLKHYKAQIEYVPPPSLPRLSCSSNLGVVSPCPPPPESTQWLTLDTNEFHMLHAFNVAAESTQTAKQCYAECDDGVITLLILKKVSRLETIQFLINTSTGAHTQMDTVQIIQAKQVRVTLCPVHRSPVNIDGELHKTPSVLNLRCMESAASIFVGNTAEQDEEEELEDDQVLEDELENDREDKHIEDDEGEEKM